MLGLLLAWCLMAVARGTGRQVRRPTSHRQPVRVSKVAPKARSERRVEAGASWSRSHGNASLLCFVHVPKNGGTSFRREVESGRGVGELQWQARWLPRKAAAVGAVGCSPWHTPDSALAGAGRPEPCAAPPGVAVRRALVLRHPYERAVSQFYWRVGSTWTRLLGYGADARAMNDFIVDAVANASRPEGVNADGSAIACPGGGKKCKIYDFVRGGKFHQDCHWLPQVDYLSAEPASPGPWHDPPLTFCYGTRSYLDDLRNYSARTEPLESAPGTTEALGDLVKRGQCDPHAADRDCDKWAALEDATLAALNAHYVDDFRALGFQSATTAADLLVHSSAAGVRSLAIPGAPRGCAFPIR